MVFWDLCVVAGRYADRATERNMAATAEMLERAVSRGRTLLAESGLGALARQGSGGGGARTASLSIAGRDPASAAVSFPHRAPADRGPAPPFWDF